MPERKTAKEQARRDLCTGHEGKKVQGTLPLPPGLVRSKWGLESRDNIVQAINIQTIGIAINVITMMIYTRCLSQQPQPKTLNPKPASTEGLQCIQASETRTQV